MARGKYLKKRLRKQLITDCSFSTRTLNALLTAGIKTKADLFNLNDRELSAIPRIGVKAIDEIHAVLNQ